MSQLTETEVLRRIHHDLHYIELGDWPDEPSCLELRVVGEENIKYWGKLSLTMPASMAMQLGKALVAAAKEKGAEE